MRRLVISGDGKAGTVGDSWFSAPYNITQRGNRRQQTFFGDDDYEAYLELMAEWCREQGVEIWSYCLMPNHVHLIAVPKSAGEIRGHNTSCGKIDK